MSAYPYPEKERTQYLTDSGSSTECTGLIPSAPLNEDEFFNYQDVYSFLPQPTEDPSREL